MTKLPVASGILETYYNMWKDGRSESYMRNMLYQLFKLSKVKYDFFQPYFIIYCKENLIIETRKGLANGTGPIVIALTEERWNTFLELVTAGFSYPDIAYQMNVPLVTIMEVWLKDELFAALVKSALQRANANVVRALYTSAIGYKHVEVEETELYDNNENLLNKKVIRKNKRVVPDVGAIKFWLCNKSPETWDNQGDRLLLTSKGKILDFIDDQLRDTSEFSKYDKAQEEFDKTKGTKE